MSEALHPIRAYRQANSLSLEQLADLIACHGVERPSTAKLSRIETGIQPVPFDILPALKEITGLRAQEIEPTLRDQAARLAELLDGAA